MLICNKADSTFLWQLISIMPLRLLIVANQVSRNEAKILTSLSWYVNRIREMVNVFVW